MSSAGDFAIEGLPPHAPEILRRRLGLDPSAPLRATYIPGPGDLGGTYDAWRRGQHDVRVPIITYSAQYFELMKRLNIAAQVLVQHPSPSAVGSGFTFQTVGRPGWSTRAEYFASEKAYGNDVVEAVDTFDPHLILASSDFPSAFWPRLTSGTRRLILTAHNTFWPMKEGRGDLKALYRRTQMLARARGLSDAICTSSECARQIAWITRGRIQGLVQFPQMVHRYPVKKVDKVRNLLFLGRIEENKGIFMLLEAFAALRTEFDDLNLVFAGSGGASADLDSRVAELGDRRATFVGRLDASGVHKAIEAADLVVCPTMSTFNEGLAVVGFEAAAHGVPTLLSSVVPATEALGAACAVFPADDQKALQSVLRELIVDDRRISAMGEALASIREGLYDRRRSWGSQLARVLLRQ